MDGNPECKLKGVILPVPTNQRMNSYLKEIADLCGISKRLTTHHASQIASHSSLQINTLQNLKSRQVTVWKRAKLSILHRCAFLTKNAFLPAKLPKII